MRVSVRVRCGGVRVSVRGGMWGCECEGWMWGCEGGMWGCESECEGGMWGVQAMMFQTFVLLKITRERER